MIIKTLVENTAISERYSCEHGLSLYVETKNHKILFDTGASGIFADNAEKLNVDLAQVDIAFISHGHYDHGGGLETFLKLNDKAKIYINKSAFKNHFALRADGNKEYIGLPEHLKANKRIIPINDKTVIDKGICAFSGVTGDLYNPSGNKALLMENHGNTVPDDFSHEQNLIVKEDGKTLLLAGCAHKGIVNIMEYIKTENMLMPNVVIGGFHLYSRVAKDNESRQIVEEIGRYLNHSGPKYYTCHCTGMESYAILKEVMGDKIDYLATGSELTI